MKTKSKDNYSKIRIDQINELYKWGIEHTNLKNVSLNDTVKFFFGDKENVPLDLANVSKIFHELSSHAMKIFNIGNYVASEYAMNVILQRTKGFDIAMLYKEIFQGDILIRPLPSSSAKIKTLQETISQMNKEELDTSEAMVIERLIKREGLSETDVKSCIEKALKLGVITKTELGKLSL